MAPTAIYHNMKKDHYFNEIVPPAYILTEYKPQDVAKAMVEYGCQAQPFYIFDMNEVHQRIQHFKAMMPRIQVHYGMKSNDTVMLLKMAMASGLKFICASPHEIYKLRLIGVPSSSIIYGTPKKTPAQMQYAKVMGIKVTTFDSSYELKKLKDNWPEARLLIQIKIEVENKTLDNKFGCDFEREAVQLLDEAAYYGLKVVGVNFYVGALSATAERFTVGFQRAKALFDYETRAGRGMNVIDIGGGFAGDKTDRIDKISKTINKMITELFPNPDVLVIAEPGRYICESAFTLYCSISNVRRVKNSNINRIYINDGVYGTIRYSEKWHLISKLQTNVKTNSSDTENTILWGPSCDSLDQVMAEHDVLLPICTPSDWLVFECHGAYTITHSTKFSSLQIPLIQPVISVDLWNKLKRNKAFNENDFKHNPDIVSSLPSTLPLPLNPNGEYYHTKNHTLLE